MIMAEGFGSKEVPQAAQFHEELQQPTVISDMALPGFRFHPTEEELVGYYLRRMVQGRRTSVELIASLDLYQYDPWELPAMAFMGEKEWFFFCPRDKKYPNGARPNRVTASGYWKATGTDRAVRCTVDFRCIGLKKTLVFYTGRAPRGNKTDWIMNEYRMPKLVDRSDSGILAACSSITHSTLTSENFITKNDVALCRIYRKSSPASTSGTYLAVLREGVLNHGSNNHHQHLLQLERSLQANAQNHSSGSHDCLMASPATQIPHLLQDSRLDSQSTTAAFPPSTSRHDHQAPEANSLRSSHALMARLVEETSCYDGRSTRSTSTIDCSRSPLEGSRRQLQNALRMAVAKLEAADMGCSPRTATTTEECSLESEGSCIDIFQHLRKHQQGVDLGRTGDVPGEERNQIRAAYTGCLGAPASVQQSPATDRADQEKLQQNSMLECEEVQSLVHSCNQMQQRYYSSSNNAGAYSRLLLPTSAQHWRRDGHSSSSSSSQPETQPARLGFEAFSGITFPL